MDRSGGIDVSLHTLVSSLCRTGMQLQIVDERIRSEISICWWYIGKMVCEICM